MQKIMIDEVVEGLHVYHLAYAPKTVEPLTETQYDTLNII